MLYKRRFGKRGLVAVVGPGESFQRKEILARVDSACIQTGITYDYEVTFCTLVIDDDQDPGVADYFDLVKRLIGEGYIALISIGPVARSATSAAISSMGMRTMHIEIRDPGDGRAESTDSFGIQNLHPLFEKNMTPDDRLSAAGIDPEQYNKNLASMDYRQVAERLALTTEFLDADGCVVVIDAQGKPHHVNRFSHEESKNDLPMSRVLQPKVFEA